MSKQETIEAIRQCNPSAAEAFLSAFPENALQQYLLRLTQLKDHRGRDSRWVRPDITPALAQPQRAA